MKTCDSDYCRFTCHLFVSPSKNKSPLFGSEKVGVPNFDIDQKQKLKCTQLVVINPEGLDRVSTMRPVASHSLKAVCVDASCRCLSLSNSCRHEN